MWLISPSVSCVVFNKAVFNDLLTPLDSCCILLIFTQSVEVHSCSPRRALGPFPRKERAGIHSVTLDLQPFPTQVWLLNEGRKMETKCLNTWL